MSSGHYGIVTGGTIANLVLWDPTTPAIPPAAGQALTTALDAISPMPQIGWTATVTAGVWTFTAPAAAAPTPAQIATAALAAGAQIVSTGTAALNGTYALDVESRSDIMAEMVSLLNTGNFTNGTATLGYADTSGTFHSFTPTAFKAFAVAIGGFVGACKAVIVANSGTVPALPLTIP